MASDQYLSRCRVLFTKRFFPLALPPVIASACLAAAHRLCQGDARRAAVMTFRFGGAKNTRPQGSEIRRLQMMETPNAPCYRVGLDYHEHKIVAS